MCAWSKPIATATARRGIAPSSISVAGMCWRSTSISASSGPWIECPVGITAREKATPPKTLVQEVVAQEPDVRVFVVHSEERLAYERAQRIKAMDRVRTRLEKLQRRIVDGRLKAAEKVGAAATRVLAPKSWPPLL
jgi:hypothetical protein